MTKSIPPHDQPIAYDAGRAAARRGEPAETDQRVPDKPRVVAIAHGEEWEACAAVDIAEALDVKAC